MTGIRTAGLVAGLIFGIVLAWQGAGAAFLILLFALVGWLLGLGVWVGWRLYTGELDPEAIKALVDTIFANRGR